MKCDLPYVDGFRDRHGKHRYYFRRRGKRVVLPGVPGSAEFVAAYQTALDAKPAGPAIRAKAGTFDALREEYLQSAEFGTLRETTRREMRYVLDAICLRPNPNAGGKVGDNPVAKLERKHVLRWRDSMVTKPGAANKMLRVLKTLLRFGVDRGYRKENPAAGIRELKGGRFRSWTDEELLAFEARWEIGTTERTGYALALYTAQRRADLVKMKWSHIVGAAIYLRQSKTGTGLAIHMHPDLLTALAAVQPRSENGILVGKRGKAFNPVTFGHLMAEAIEKAGLPTACVLHGLRKAAARLVAETGGNVSSMTGHLSPKMAEEYARDASQKRMSKDAVVAWSRDGKKRKKTAKPG